MAIQEVPKVCSESAFRLSSSKAFSDSFRISDVAFAAFGVKTCHPCYLGVKGWSVGVQKQPVVR
jgi:hypothetical protein